jgi:hypothetical protein
MTGDGDERKGGKADDNNREGERKEGVSIVRLMAVRPPVPHLRRASSAAKSASPMPK